MKAKLVAVLCAGIAMAAQADVVYNNPGYKWLASDGYWNVAANWEEGHQPTSFQAAIFDKGATVRIPAATADAPFTEGSLFYPRVGNFPYGDKLTIDGSGTYWLKKVNPADTFNRSFLCLADFGGYFWGGEGMNANKQDDDWYWYATNLVMTVERGPSAAEDGATLTLKQGFLNLYDPLGHSDHDHTFNLFHSTRPNLSVIYEEGTHTRTKYFGNRANGENSLFWIKGGLHEFFNNFSGKSATSANPGLTRISGGVVDVKTGWAMPQQANGPTDGSYDVVGRIRVDGTGEFRHTDGDTLYVGWGGAHTKGYFEMDEDAVARVGNIYMGGQANTWGSFEMTGNSRLEAYDNYRILIVGREKDSIASFKMDGNATASLGQVRVGAEDGNAGRPHVYGRLSLAGESRMDLNNSMHIGRSLNSTGIVEVAGNATLDAHTFNIQLGDSGAGAYGRLEVSEKGRLNHGHIYLGAAQGTESDLVFGDNASNQLTDGNTVYTLFVGKTSNVVARATFKDDSKTAFGQVRVGGDDQNRGHDTASGEMYIRDNASVTISNHLYLARAYNSTALLDISGGSLDMVNSQILLGDASNSVARVQMTGGRLTTRSYVQIGNRGWGTGMLDMTGGEMTAAHEFRIGAGEDSIGMAHFGGTAKFTQTDNILYVGYGDRSTSRLLIDGQAEVTGKFWGGRNNNATRDVTIDVKGDATFNANGQWVGLSPGKTRMTVSENATLNLLDTLSLGWSQEPNAFAEMVLEDNARLTGAGKTLRLCEHTDKNASSALYFRGGHADDLTLNVELYGTNTLFEVSGGDHKLNHVFVYQGHAFETATNTFRVTGGRIVFDDWMVIGNNNYQGHVEITGGEVIDREIRLGFGNQGNLLSTMRISGGVLTVQNITAENPNADCRFYFGSGTGNSSRGHLEMTGGEIRTMAMMSSHSAEGRSSARFDGGAIVQILRSHPSDALIQGLTFAEVGETGLTIRPNGFDSWINQGFTDVEGRDGAVTVAGSGSLRVAKNSTHARTVVDGGKLVYGAGVTTFGRRIELKNGGVLSLAGETGGISCDKLVVGTATSTGVLNLDADDRITITGEDGVEIVNGVLDVSHASENGRYPLFIVASGASIDPGKVSRLRLKSPNPYKSYTVTADGNLVVADRTFTDLTWKGGESADWATAANWDPAQVPGPGARTTFGAEGTKSVSVPAGAATDAIVFNAGDYVLSGEGPLALDAIVENKSAGKVSLSVPMTLGDVVALNGVAGSETELSGALSAQRATIVKSGSAKATVAGENTALTADWQVSGGTLGFGDPQAFGSVGSTLELGPATLAYTAQEPMTAPSALRLNTTRNTAAVVDVAEGSEVAFPGVEMVSGRLAKKGAGTLKFAFGAGDYKAYDPAGAQVDNPSDNIVFADSGDAPTSDNMFCGMTVAEGKLVFEGQGSNETKVTHLNGLSVGDSYANARANAELEFRNLTFNNNVVRYLSIGHRQLSSFSKPQVRVLDGAYLELNRLCIGWGPQVRTECGFAVTGSVVRATDHILFAEGGNGTARVSVGPDGHLIANTYIQIRETVDAVIDGPGAEIAVTSTAAANDAFTWGGDLIYQNGNARGSLTFRNGGALRIGSRIHGQNYNVNGTTSGPGVQLVFDGGLLAFASSGTSIIAKPQYQGIQTVGAGLTVSVAEGAVQSLTFPIRGEGGVVKTGKGELVFTDVRDMTAYNDQGGKFNFVYNKTDIVLGQYAGETVVREGKLTLADGMLPETAKVRVEADGTLDLGGNSFTFASAEGAGTIANGSLTTTFKATKGGDAVRFENVALGSCKVDLPSDVQPGDAFTFAQLGEGTTATPENWNAYVDGKHVRAAFAKDGEGRITVTRQKPLALTILVH